MSSVVVKSSNQDQVLRALTEYVQELRRKHPEIRRVLWFGSRVDGRPTPGSDVDLCLVLESSDRKFRDRIPLYLPDRGFPVGLDLFPYTEAELERLASAAPGWYREIQEGREV